MKRRTYREGKQQHLMWIKDQENGKKFFFKKPLGFPIGEGFNWPLIIKLPREYNANHKLLFLLKAEASLRSFMISPNLSTLEFFSLQSPVNILFHICPILLFSRLAERCSESFVHTTWILCLLTSLEFCYSLTHPWPQMKHSWAPIQLSSSLC